MKKLKLIIALTLFISFVGYSQTTKEYSEEVPNDWKTIDETDYTIQYPGNFDINTSGQMGTRFILFSKPTSPEDPFLENINLIIQDLSGQSMNLDEYVKLSENQIKTFITNGNIIESTRITSANSEFQKFIYTGIQGQYNLQFEQYYWIENNKAYVLTFTAEIDEIEIYKDVCEKIMNSFRIK